MSGSRRELAEPGGAIGMLALGLSVRAARASAARALEARGLLRHAKAASRGAFLLFLILFLGLSLLESGVWHRTESHAPSRLAREPQLHTVPVGHDLPLHRLLKTRSDIGGADSDLRLWIDGQEWGPAHALHDTIRQGGTKAFSHWGDRVYFKLPAGADVDRTVATIRYTVRPTFGVHLGIALATALALMLWHMADPEGVRSLRSRIARFGAPATLAFPALGWMLAVLSALYILTILWGVWSGYAHPTAALFDIIGPIGSKWVRILDLDVAAGAIGLAAAGSACAWMARARLLNGARVRHSEAALARLCERYGIVIIFCLLLIPVSAGGWSGHVQAYDLNYMSLAQQLPHSDAAGYLTDAFDAIRLGRWNMFGSRRPVAEAFRTAMAFLAGHSYAGGVLLQIGLIAASLFFAARSLARSYGIWSAVAFVGLVYSLARPFTSTTMTEPLSLVLALISIAYWADAIRLHSQRHAFVAFAALGLALWVRMGSLLAIPAVGLWIVFAFGTARGGSRRSVFAVAAIVLLLFALNASLAFLYGAPGATTGSNFAYTLCGLSRGTHWGECYKTYLTELSAAPESEHMRILLHASWENFSAHPAVLLRSLWVNVWEFAHGLPRFLLAGYMETMNGIGVGPSKAVLMAWSFVVLVGLVVAWSGFSSLERTFWACMLLSIAASAAIIMADDGWRALHATHPFVAAFVALAFARRSVTRDRTASCSWRLGALGIAVLGLALITLPALAHALMKREAAPYTSAAAQCGSGAGEQHLVWGGRALSGFIVVPDGRERPISVPSIYLADYLALLELPGLAAEWGPLSREAVGRAPFALVWASRLGGSGANPAAPFYLVPPYVLEQRAVRAWRFVLDEGADRGGALRGVVKAEAVRANSVARATSEPTGPGHQDQGRASGTPCLAGNAR